MNVGIVRSTSSLEKARSQIIMILAQLEELFSVSEKNVEICELRNMVKVAQLITDQSLLRKENRGTFFNTDLTK